MIDILKRALEQEKISLSCYGLDLLARLVVAIIQIRSANLKKVAAVLCGSAQVESHYRRLQRFFASAVPPDVFARLILARTAIPGQPLLLTLDRTHWKLGKTDQNILCLGILYQGVSIPFFYESLAKAGNSNTKERKRILTKALRYLKPYRCTLLADREFVGKEWFQFLLKQKDLDFVIRIKSNNWILQENGLGSYVDQLSPRQRKNTTKIYPNITLYGSLKLNLVCHRPAKDELLYLATNRPDLENTLALYRKRWSLETAFGFLKSRGFDLESTHLTDPKRLNLLIGVLSLCLLWSLQVGAALDRQKPVPRKKHGRKAISLFRLGLDHLQHIFSNIQYRFRDFLFCCQLLVSCT